MKETSNDVVDYYSEKVRPFLAFAVCEIQKPLDALYLFKMNVRLYYLDVDARWYFR